jgi:PAS domain S-box-containing protein
VITLAPDPDYPPIEYFDENRKYCGIAADYVALLEKKLDFRFKITHLQSWDEILDKAKSWQIDMFGAAAETPQRSEYMLFTHPFVEFTSVIIVRKNVSESLSLEKLDGMKVAVVSGYADHDYIKNNYPQLQLDEVPTVATGLRKVSFGMVDALVANLATATYYIEKEGITNLRLAGNTGYTYRLGFGVRKDWPELINVLENGLAQIEPNEKEAIFKKWVHLEQESLFANRKFWTIVLSGLAVAFFVVLGLLVWNRSLKSVVSLRTQELSNELAVRKRAEEALRESQTLLSTIIESIPFEFWAIGQDGRYMLVNAACVDHYGNIVGKTPEEICDDRETLSIWQKNNRNAFGGKLVKEDVRSFWGVAERFYHSIIAPIRDGDQIRGILGVNIDIAERKMMEEELRKARDELELRVRERTAELEKANQELRQVPSKLLAVQEEERRRLVSELHDSIGQTLAAMKFWVETVLGLRDAGDDSAALNHLEQFVPILQQSIEETRSISMGLRPSILDSMGLLATLEWLRRECMKLYPDRHIELETTVAEEEIPENLKVCIFRITQEALNNIAKHSRAEWVDISLSKVGDGIELAVSDDGVGMDPELILQTSTARSLGLTSMRERAELTGGSFAIGSTPGEGTTIRACWPNEAENKLQNGSVTQ